jgi:hypothetical protein
MRTVNRSAVIVMPAQPFLDWLHQADPTSIELTLEDLRRDPTIYLLPEYDTDQQALSHLKKRCREIFEEQLDGWFRISSAWPAERDFGSFRQWFDWQFYSVIFDLCPKMVVYGED